LDLDVNGNYVTQDLFNFHITKTDSDGTIHGQHRPSGIAPSFLKEAKAQGYKINEGMFKTKSK